MNAFTVKAITTDYSGIQEGTIEGITFDQFVNDNGLEIITRDQYTAVVSAEWGNGEGTDIYEITFDNVAPESINQIIRVSSDLAVFIGTFDKDGDRNSGQVYRFNESIRTWQYYNVMDKRMNWCNAGEYKVPSKVITAYRYYQLKAIQDRIAQLEKKLTS